MNVIEYPIIGQVEMKSGAIVPMIKINMISDERWQQLKNMSGMSQDRSGRLSD